MKKHTAEAVRSEEFAEKILILMGSFANGYRSQNSQIIKKLRELRASQRLRGEKIQTLRSHYAPRI
jgi:hypothetical protein